MIYFTYLFKNKSTTSLFIFRASTVWAQVNVIRTFHRVKIKASFFFFNHPYKSKTTSEPRGTKLASRWVVLKQHTAGASWWLGCFYIVLNSCASKTVCQRVASHSRARRHLWCETHPRTREARKCAAHTRHKVCRVLQKRSYGQEFAHQAGCDTGLRV